jgi:hypothetical protein
LNPLLTMLYRKKNITQEIIWLWIKFEENVLSFKLQSRIIMYLIHSYFKQPGPVASRWQTLSYNVVSRTPHLSGIQTHNVGGDRHWLHRKWYMQHAYDHYHDNTSKNMKNNLVNSMIAAHGVVDSIPKCQCIAVI